MRLRLLLLSAVALALIASPALGVDNDDAASVFADDIITEPADDVLLPQVFEEVDFFAGDPLRLVAQAPFIRRHSLDTDKFTVWLCDLPGGVDFVGPGLNGYVDFLNTTIRDYYLDISNGRYDPVFTAGGSVSAQNVWSDEGGTKTTCNDKVKSAAPAGFEAAFIITDDDFPFPEYPTGVAGIGGSSFCFESVDCPSIGPEFPANSRKAIVEGKHLAAMIDGPLDPDPWSVEASVSLHEIGHVLHWPHSSSGPGASYDNPMDLMSGAWNVQVGDYEYIPPTTIAFNRYMSGWIDPDDVVTAQTGKSFVLQPYDVAGDQMLVVPTGVEGKFYTLGARANGQSDPINVADEGVEVYLIDWVDEDCRSTTPICYSTFHYQFQHPPSSLGTGHVLKVGDELNISGTVLSVTGRVGKGFTVEVSGDAPPVGSRFTDVPHGHTFEADIEWMAAEGITKGCNPSQGNTRFCPDDFVTREQMAAFLVRAMGYTDDGGGDLFIDDGGSTFEGDIDRMATAGVTKGCNPSQGNTKYCPKDFVTREQMAAFLVRAMGYVDNGGGDLFIDDDGSTFEGDIDRMATAGVTKGCNPSEGNTKYCPKKFVTRGQMAAFLHRALG